MVSQAARNTPTTPAAATAAAQAFLANRVSNGNLSSAAAAAALKTHATPPTPVSEVQTKRTQRRGSASSNGSGPRQTLQRQGSSGSMTERTFREPSPSRPPSPRAEELPPIPAVPQNYAKQASKGKLIRRPSSAEPPQRITSPVPTNQAGRGVSLDRSGSIPKGEVPPLPTTPILAKRNTSDQRQQAAYRASVNFSRPMSPQFSSPSSPTPSAQSSKQTPESKKSEGMISTADAQNIDHPIQNAATRPVKKKKKKTASQVVEGSHLNVGHSSSKPTGTAVNGGIGEKTKKQVVDKPLKVTTPEKRTASSLQHEGGSESDDSEQIPSSPERSATSVGKLTKQPSIVREDREGEELEERRAQAEAVAKGREPEAELGEEVKEIESHYAKKANGTILPSTSFSEGEPEAKQEAGAKPASENGKPIAVSQQVNAPPKEQKRLSWSPSRSARFSASPVLEIPGMKRHVPPARAASPAKSALKHSPSVRVPSPSTLGLGEVSDTISLGSADGITSGRKKKTVRVSFDDEPLVVGEGADPQSNANSPILFSPQNRDPNNRGLFNLTRNRPDLQADDDMMSPVPKLPSFGSIRGRREQLENSDASPHVFEGDEQAQKNLQQMTSSSDHAIGALIAQHTTPNAGAGPLIDPHEPLPPEVTTVEGSGYHSDSESSDDGASDNIAIKSTEFSEDSAPIEASSLNRDIENVPTIAVLPATPGQESIHGDRDSWLGNMPGSFPSADHWAQESNTATEISVQPEPATPAKVGISEPEPEALVQEQSPKTPVVGQVSESIARQTAASDDESDDTGDSIYSDAEEDAADLEGDGFGSINAIVDSPTVTSSTSPLGKAIEPSSVEYSPSPTTHTQRHDENWEKARSFWSEARQGTKAEPTATQSSESPSAPPKQSNSRQIPDPARSTSPQQPAQKASQSMSPPPKSKLRDIPEAPTMRKSMRGSKTTSQNESATSLRYPVIGSSRGTNEPPRLAKTLRQGPSAAASQPPQDQKAPTRKRQSTQKPVSEPKQRSGMVSNGNAKTLRKTNEPATQSPPSALAKKQPLPFKSLANDSDSDSSFKRARRKPANDNGRYSMKRSMRAAPMEGRPQSASFSSTSTAGPPPRSTMRDRPMSTTGMGMRTSMRGPETRVTSPPPRSFGFGKGAKSGRDKAPRMSRKFSNSSDEGNGPMTFRSRFADSSDEDEPRSKAPLGLTPVRGIPRRGNESDSTDLEDSDDDGAKGKKKLSISLPSQPASSTLGKSEGSALASGSLRNNPEDKAQQLTSIPISPKRPEPERRRSIFGAFGRKKDKPKLNPGDLGSATRRDAPLDRAKLERSTAGQSDDVPTDIPPIPPMSPPPSRGKLQRRVTPQRLMSDTWPLPPPIPESPVSVKSVKRPLTSDGSTTPRPAFGQRKISTNTDTGDGGAIGKSGKKKRFPMLRKAFGLRD
ncbi:hypothetical protein MMC10_007138 [Thelotrema lepadinum]|nr:hypothetical protein [Thelotrema lepadinum]